MNLYHGTTAFAALKILEEGLRPRSETGHISNWYDWKAASNPKMVYLSTSDPVFYAMYASPVGRLGLVEIDFDALDKNGLLPDEDFLIGRFKEPQTPANQRYYSRNVVKYRGLWRESLRESG